MIYRCSSFITLLREKYHCEIIPLQGRAVQVKYGNQSCFIYKDKSDRIDYEEIYHIYNKLLLPGLPGDSELVRIE